MNIYSQALKFFCHLYSTIKNREIAVINFHIIRGLDFKILAQPFSLIAKNLNLK